MVFANCLMGEKQESVVFFLIQRQMLKVLSENLLADCLCSPQNCGEDCHADFCVSSTVKTLSIRGEQKLFSYEKYITSIIFLCHMLTRERQFTLKCEMLSQIIFFNFCPMFTLNLTTFYFCFLLKK